MNATPNLTLWGVGTSRTIRPHWAMHELGLAYETRPIGPRTGETKTAEYTKLNPRQKIPLLQDGDFRIGESAAIVAYLSSGRGVVIHRENCSNVAAFGKQPDKWIPAIWHKEQQRLFNAGLVVEVTNRMGILAQVATKIAAEQSNIIHVNVDSSQGELSTILFEVQVRDRAHLARLIRAIRGMTDVAKVERSLA